MYFNGVHVQNDWDASGILLANKRRKTSFLYETSFALPMAMAVSVTAMIFQLLYVPSLGFINGVTGLKINWLTDPKYAMIAIAVIQIWLSTGYAFIFMLAAVRSVPKDMIESASIDGAGPFRQLFQILSSFDNAYHVLSYYNRHFLQYDDDESCKRSYRRGT